MDLYRVNFILHNNDIVDQEHIEESLYDFVYF